MGDNRTKPVGRTAVRAALIEATAELIVEQGISMSVRDIARRAGVNHGLVHTYFGSKDALVTAAFGSVIDRAAGDVDPSGFPPTDLASRRNGELARTIARVMLEVTDDPFPAHPILPQWRDALANIRPHSTKGELDEALMISSALALGWALYQDFLCRVLDLERDQVDAVERRILELVAEIGGIPTVGDPTSTSAPAPD